MQPKKQIKISSLTPLRKCPTGIQGFDEITMGGLPAGRTTLICGNPGCGKTLLAAEFLYRGATSYNEPGVFISFEENPADLSMNVSSIGLDLPTLVSRKKLLIDHIVIDKTEIEESGDYNLDGLFIRMGHAIDRIGAKRVVLDSIETLFGGLRNEAILRSEIRRLFQWLKDRGVTTIATAERGEGSFTRHGISEYVSDCVILLDLRVIAQIATRRLRIVKYRGSTHGTNEYPFLFLDNGVSVVPITSLGLSYAVTTGRLSSGIKALDTMLGGKGYYRGSTVLVSGMAGVGKSSLGAHFVDAACRRKERSLYIAHEESMGQIIRNMRSIGIDLQKWVDKDLLRFYAARPTMFGLEMHLENMRELIDRFRPSVVVIDPITGFDITGTFSEVRLLLVRIIDILKSRGISVMMTSLSAGDSAPEQSEVGISSQVDTWISMRNIELSGERKRGLFIIKSRGMKHSSEVKEFVLTDQGVQIKALCRSPQGSLVGHSREILEKGQRAQASINPDRKQSAKRRS